MKKLQKQFILEIIFYSLMTFIMALIMAALTKKYIVPKDNQLKDNINQVASKLNAFKEETKTDFNHLQQKLDKLIEKVSEINEGQKLETNKDQKPVKEPVNRHTVQESEEAGYSAKELQQKNN